MSNRFRKYCLGLSTRGGDQRPLSRGRRRHRLMSAGGEGGPACGKPDLRVPVCTRVHVLSCAHAWMCSSDGSGAGCRSEWGWRPPDTAGAEPCPAPVAASPVLALGCQRGAPAFAVLQLCKGSS